jgi:predicted  nucleic acid-binding Zn-ribbon protein
MGRSKTLYQVQKYDTQIDNASKRIQAINAILSDNKLLNQALETQNQLEKTLITKKKSLSSAETAVEDHALKIDQNQKKLYGGLVKNPKDLEDLQLESESLNNYLSVLEERQLEAMVEMEEALKNFKTASTDVSTITAKMEAEHADLLAEREELKKTISHETEQKGIFISSNVIPDLQTYEKLRLSSGQIAVTLMISDSCSSCGANIPSAIAQEARSPLKLAFCPTCKRILHPG